MSDSYGGNQVLRISADRAINGQQIKFAECSYNYYFVSLNPKAVHDETRLQSYTVLCLKGQNGIVIETDNQTHTLHQGDTAQMENLSCRIKTTCEHAEILIAGSTQRFQEETNISITTAGKHKKVTKPWGHELWFNGEHPGYCLKEVMITRGNRTSLQYHNFKEETNVLYAGSANLIYKANNSISNDNVSGDDLNSITLTPTSVIHVVPNVLHRIEAVTDVLLYETSTPYLDDVIRVQDDKSRYNGRVESEHV